MKSINRVLGKVRKESPALYWIVNLSLLLGLGCSIGLLVDDRLLLGVSVWLKPLKFCLSIAIYTFTVGCLMSIYPYSARKKKLIRNFVAYSLFFELLIIICQGARGVQSHFNDTAAFDALLYISMGLLTSLNVLIMILFIIDTIRLKMNTTKSIQWSILLGWLIVFFGSWIGGVMLSQLAHSVGVQDGGAGLPLVNWSTVGGDLRIAHFFGLHGIQIIPLFALWISNKWKFSMQKQIMVVSLFAIVYTGWIGYTFYQAKQGIPLIETVIVS